MLWKIAILFCLLQTSSGFVPAKILTEVIGRLDNKFAGNLGKVSQSIVHDEIMKRGLIQSVVRYFYDQPNGTQKIDLNKIDNEYYSLWKLYYDYYGKYLCNSIPLDDLITKVFQFNVARVDFDSETKDNPYAHFDAEKFAESNDRVISFKQRIMTALASKDYNTARSLSGQVLHTIQDFYSHSNWVEMGKTSELNTKIGTADFSSYATVSPTDSGLCDDNCQLVEEPCKSLFISIFAYLLDLIGINNKYITCPLKYYQCSGNILELNKLVSGYYSDQKLDDGTPVDKPVGLKKCSHGGTLDGSSMTAATGGINKDSGYLIFSPHADLHLKAAVLAINHTEYFFNEIRKSIGDTEYANFLKLKVSDSVIASASSVQICSAPKSGIISKVLITFCVLILFFFI